MAQTPEERDALLRQGNELRLAGVRLLRRVREGDLRPGALIHGIGLDDHDYRAAQTLRALQVASAPYGMGRTKARAKRILMVLRINDHDRIRDLTPDQRVALARAIPLSARKRTTTTTTPKQEAA